MKNGFNKTLPRQEHVINLTVIVQSSAVKTFIFITRAKKCTCLDIDK